MDGKKFTKFIHANILIKEVEKMTTIDTSVLATIEDNVKYTMLQLMHEILKSYNQSLDIINDLNENQQELDGRVTENANDITTINGALELVRDSIQTLNNQMAATAPSELNNKINANKDSIDTINNQLAGTSSSGLLTKINDNAGDIESLEGNFRSLSSKRGYLPEPVIETCNNSTVKQRGTNNYWSVPITTPTRLTEAGKIIIIMTTETLTNAGTNPLYLTFDDGSGIFTTFIPIVRYNNYQIKANMLGALPGNLMVLVLYDDPTNGLVARVISGVVTA